MTMQTERYCDTLEKLDKEKAIRAIHMAHLQLAYLQANTDEIGVDNGPALSALVECLRDAGHWGFVDGEDVASCIECGNTLNDGSDICDQCGGHFA